MKTSLSNEDGAVLLPAYHCRTMIDPALRIGAEILLYPLTNRLTPVIEGLIRCIRAATHRPRALVVPHYFGFPQDLEPIIALCESENMALIEDCAHAYFGTYNGRALGESGDFAVASPSKFFPVEDGGILIAKNGVVLPTPRPNSIAFETRGFARSLSRTLARLRTTTNAETAPPCVTSHSPSSPSNTNDVEYWSDSPSNQYEEREEDRRAYLCSRFALNLVDRRTLVQRRRQNYQQWSEELADVPNCQLLFPTLPEHVVPYMFPLLIDQPSFRFPMLKRMGVPIHRWDELAASDCEVANRYRDHLIQLPCHQSLTSAELDWTIRTVITTMRYQAP